MIKLDTWESFNGTRTPITEMDDKHLNNAIACIERNDPRYGAKHGAALPALYAERDRRRAAGVKYVEYPLWSIDFETDTRTPTAGPAYGRPDYALLESRVLSHMSSRSAYGPNAGGVEIGKTADGTPVYAAAGVPMLSAIDDRADRAHRRCDKLETELRNFKPTNNVIRRLDALEAAAAKPRPVYDARVEHLRQRVLVLEQQPTFKAAAALTDRTDNLNARVKTLEALRVSDMSALAGLRTTVAKCITRDDFRTACATLYRAAATRVGRLSVVRFARAFGVSC